MLQLVQDLKSGGVEVVDLPDPRPARGRLVVRTQWSLISPGTEQAISRVASRSLIGKAVDRPDQARKVVDKAVKDGVGAAYAAVRARLEDVLTPGYSSMGTVESVGEDVEGVQVGDRVGCVGANFACHAERVSIWAPLCLALPDGLEDRWGAFGALGGIAAHGVRTAEVDAGAVVVVIGLGLVGQLASQLATAAGARVVAIDTDHRRVELALRLGAVAGAAPDSDDTAAVVREVAKGAGADAVVVAAATKDSGPIALAARLARDRAVVSVVGDVGLDVPRGAFYEKELQLRVSRSYGPGRYDPAYEQEGRDYPMGYVRWTERRLISYFFDEVDAGRIHLDPLVTHEFPLARGADAYAALEEPGRMAILLRYDEPAPPRRRVEPPRAVRPVKPEGRLRVGLIGPGLFARSTLLPLLEKLDVEIAAVAGASGPRALGVGRRVAAAYVAGDPGEILADADIDAVVIATRHDSHPRLAARALEAGKGVFLEKPLAIDDEGVALLEPLLGDGARLVVDFNRSHSPAVLRVVDHFARRTDPVHVHYRVNAGWLEPDHWLRQADIGGGRLVGEGCHFVDLCSLIVGHRVASIQVSRLGSGPRTLTGDGFVLTLDYADGSVATIAHVPSGPSGLAKERIEVLGAGRSAVIDDFRRVRLHGGRRGRGSRPALPVQDKGHEALLAAGLEFIRRGGGPPVPYERIVETTRVTLLARAALAAGSAAAVELSPP